MAVKEGTSIEVGSFTPYYTERPSFSRNSKINFNKQIFISDITSSNNCKRTRINIYELKVLTGDSEPLKEQKRAKIEVNEQVVSHVELSKEKLVSATQMDPITNTMSLKEDTPGNARPCIINIANCKLKQVNGTPENAQVQTSQTNCNSQYLNNPYLDHLKQWTDDGEPCSDPEARMNEIIEEMKLWESEELPNYQVTRIQNFQEVSKLPEYSVDRGLNSSTDVSKIKVDCPHCKKNVVAVTFVRHLSRCMRVQRRTRKSRRRT